MNKTAIQVEPLLWQRVALIGLSVALLGAFAAKPVADAEAESKNLDSRQLLSKTMGALVSAWNKQDAESIVGLFLPDAVLVMPTGKVARTRSAIRERLIEEWKGKLKDTTLSYAVEAVSMDSSDAAIVKGKYRLEGVKVLGFEKAPEGSFVLSHRKQQARWMIAKAELLGDKAD